MQQAITTTVMQAVVVAAGSVIAAYLAYRGVRATARSTVEASRDKLEASLNDRVGALLKEYETERARLRAERDAEEEKWRVRIVNLEERNTTLRKAIDASAEREDKMAEELRKLQWANRNCLETLENQRVIIEELRRVQATVHAVKQDVQEVKAVVTPPEDERGEITDA